MVSVFVDEHISFTICKGADIRKLLVNGHITLTGGGIPGISYGGAGRTG
jgi:hypothetical protein